MAGLQYMYYTERWEEMKYFQGTTFAVKQDHKHNDPLRNYGHPMQQYQSIITWTKSKY